MQYVALEEIHPHIDFFNVMTDDLQETWANETRHRSPMYASAGDKDQKLNVAAAMEEYARIYQVPRNKLSNKY